MLALQEWHGQLQVRAARCCSPLESKEQAYRELHLPCGRDQANLMYIFLVLFCLADFLTFLADFSLTASEARGVP